MIEKVAAKLDENNIVLELIVGEAEWATQMLGGRWVQAFRGDETKTYPTFGDLWDEQTNDFIHKETVIINAS
jgi:hypothetical protein